MFSNKNFKLSFSKNNLNFLSTKKIFWDDPYQNILETAISHVSGSEVIFEQTISYSESGGQESDRTVIWRKRNAIWDKIPILNSIMIPDKCITYLLPDKHDLNIGDKVIMEIEWARRYNLMRLHFSCELILVLINRLFGNIKNEYELMPEEIDNLGIVKSGAHISEKNARLTFLLAEQVTSYLPLLLEQFNKIIDSDLEIETGYLNKPEQYRYWRIAGLATVPCGGTHVKSTSEIGLINLKRETGGKGKETIKISLQDESVILPKYSPRGFK